MRIAFPLCLLMAISAFGAEPEAKRLMNFEAAKVGELPKGWTAAKTGKGDGSVWKIVEDKEAPGGKALMQTSAAGEGAFFSICIADAAKYTDVDMIVSFKSVAGNEDQGGGLVWRYKDANNYYIARYNPLENNFRVYKVVDGKRSAALKDSKPEPLADKWHTLRIVHKGDQIQCYLNDKLHLEAKDDTFKEAGKVGVWTKADAQTRCAGLKVSGK